MRDVFEAFASSTIGICVLVGFAALALVAFGGWWWSICRFTVGPARLAFVFFRGRPWGVISSCEIYFRYPRIANIFTIDVPKSDQLGYDAQGQKFKRTFKLTSRNGVPVEADFSGFARPAKSDKGRWCWYMYEEKEIDEGVLDRVGGVLSALTGILEDHEFRDHLSQINAFLRLVLLFEDQFPNSIGTEAEWREFMDPAKHAGFMKLAEKHPIGESDVEEQFGLEFDSFIVSRVGYEAEYAKSLEAKERAKLDGDAAIVKAQKDAEVVRVAAEASAVASTALLEATDAWIAKFPGDSVAALAAAQAALRQPITVTVQDVRGGAGKKPIVVVQSGGGSKP